MKRFLALLIIAVLAVSVLASCNTGSGTNESSAPETSEEQQVSAESSNDSEWKDENGKWVPKHKVVDQKGQTFTIIVRGSSAGTYQSDDFTYGEDSSGLYGDILGDAVKERNRIVESLYNVELVVVRSDNIVNDINTDISGTLGNYDAIMPSMSQLSTLAAENSLYDLTSIEGFDVYAPWYDRNATEAFSINGSVYFTTGDITILNKVGAPSILFNKDMVTNYRLESPYDLVRSHQWTFDKMVELGKQVSSTTNDDPFMNNYGMLTSYGDIMVMFGASGEKIVRKDEDDLPILSFTAGNERAVGIAQKVLETMANGDDWMIYAQDPAFSSDIWVESLRLFSEGHALFRPSYFSATTKLRKNTDMIFGIVPHPLMDSTQEEYVSYCGTGSTAGIAIPKSCRDKDFSAYMIDAYSAYAKDTVTHAYYDVNLVLKDASYDSESVEMLDIIFGNIYYDMGECFNFGDIKTVFSDLAANRSSDIVSKLAGITDKMNQQIEELRENFAD